MLAVMFTTMVLFLSTKIDSVLSSPPLGSSPWMEARRDSEGAEGLEEDLFQKGMVEEEVVLDPDADQKKAEMKTLSQKNVIITKT